MFEASPLVTVRSAVSTATRVRVQPDFIEILFPPARLQNMTGI